MSQSSQQHRPQETSVSRSRPSALSLLVWAAMLGWGVWRLIDDQDPTTMQLIWSWIFVILGGGGLLLGLIVWMLKPFGSTDPVGSMANLETGLYGTQHEYKIVDESALRRLNAEFYHTTRQVFEKHGYRYLNDVINVTAARATRWAYAVIRMMLSRDGRIMIGIYNVRFSGFPRLMQLIGVLPRKMLCIDLESELTDGTFVATSNLEGLETTSEVPGVSKRHFPQDTPPAQLIVNHEQHLRSALMSKPDVEIRRITDFDDAIASQRRLQQIKSDYRLSPDFDRVAETERILGKPLSDEQRDLVQESHRRISEYRQSQRHNDDIDDADRPTPQ